MSVILNPLARICNTDNFKWLQSKCSSIAAHRESQANFVRFFSAVAEGAELAYHYTGEKILANVTRVSSSSAIHYLYNFLMIPYNHKFTDIRQAQEAIEEDIHAHLRRKGFEEEDIEADKGILREIVKKHLKATLAENPGRGKFEAALKNKLQSEEFKGLKDYKLRDLSTFELRQPNIFDKLQNVSFIFVDILSAIGMARAYKLIDTAKWVNAIGQVTGSRFLQNQDLDTWIRKGCVAGYGAKWLSTIYIMTNENNLTPNERKILKLDRISAAVDVLFHSTYLLTGAISRITNIDPFIIQKLAAFSAHSVYTITTALKPKTYNIKEG